MSVSSRGAIWVENFGFRWSSSSLRSDTDIRISIRHCRSSSSSSSSVSLWLQFLSVTRILSFFFFFFFMRWLNTVVLRFCFVSFRVRFQIASCTMLQWMGGSRRKVTTVSLNSDSFFVLILREISIFSVIISTLQFTSIQRRYSVRLGKRN